MEFKFRAGDNRPPPCLPPYSRYGYCEQALRANYSTSPNFIGNPRDFYTIHREIEKNRIRQEIIAEENMRRQMLEEEVRRELMMEREMAMRREGKMRLSVEERLTMQLDSRFQFMHQFENRWLQDQLALPGNHSLGLGIDVLPPAFPQLGDAITDENKTALGVDKKDKLIILAKPEPTLCGAKRKAATPPAGARELPITSLKKNKIEEWSCALCQVSSTCERGLKEHLQGKKHKAKVKALRTQKLQQQNSSASLPKKKKSSKPNSLAETRVASGSKLEMKVEEESLQINKSKDGEDLNNQKSNIPKKENMNVVNKKKNRVSTAGKVEKMPEARRKKFKFWCELCQVGAFSKIVMETHMKGKKHMFQIQKTKICEAVPNKKTQSTITTNLVAASDPTVKASDVGAATSLPIEKTSDADAAEPAEKAIDVNTIALPVHSEETSDANAVEPAKKASAVDTRASAVPSKKASNVTAAATASTERAKASNIAADASPEQAEKASNVAVAAAASLEPADKPSEVADAAALLWLLGRPVIH